MTPSEAHTLLPDNVLPLLPPKVMDAALAEADAGRDPRPVALAWLRTRCESFAGGDRPSSPPARLLRALEALGG
jgi:hypothetical protein